jgi:arylsulfatase A-like enzyme
MLTGLYPLRHTLRDNSLAALPAAAETLAERLAAEGYRTAAVVAARVLERRFRLDQGFEHYDQPPPPERVGHGFSERRAAEVAAAGLAWLAARDRARPFFLWLHFFDPHQPLEPPPDCLQQAGGNAYLGEVAAADRAIGRVLDALRAEGMLDELVILVVGDHGEALGAHSEATHGSFCYDSTMRVPLILRAPGVAAGERSQATVSVVDVHPTLLAAAGLGCEGVDGESLLGPLLPERGVYLESYHGHLQLGWSPLAGWVSGGRKYLHGARPELYDLAVDPGETQNLAPLTTGADLELYRRAIDELARRPVLERARVAAQESETLAELRRLGYLAGGVADAELPHPLDTTGPAPADSLWEQQLIDQASMQTMAGQTTEAIATYRALLARRPGNPTVLQELAYLLMDQRQWSEALAVLEQRLELPPTIALTHMNMGACLHQLGRMDEALLHLHRAAELNPRSIQLLRYLIELHGGRGERDEVQRYQALLDEALRD